MSEYIVKVAGEADKKYSVAICEEIEQSAKARGTGIAKREPAYVENKMDQGRAIIAIHKATGDVAGFCYIESWGHEKFVANSGLIVFPDHRGKGLSRKIKFKAFELSRKLFPKAKIFGLTTNLAVMKINSELGYIPVTYSELTDDEQFWKGCSSCVNYEILKSKDKKNCMCTGMLFDPNAKKKKRWDFMKDLKLMERLKRIKNKVFLKDRSSKLVKILGL